jgi:hypothetical protein
MVFFLDCSVNFGHLNVIFCARAHYSCMTLVSRVGESTTFTLETSIFGHCKVNVSIPVPDPYPCPTIAPISDSFSPICAHACFYSQGCNQCKCMTWLNVTSHYSLHGNGCNLQTQIAIYNDLL